MPRQKRKQPPSSDFTRASKKLGSKKIPSNRTDTNISQTQLQVPNQVPKQLSTNRGLSFSALLSRTDHHNASSRSSALNGLSNAILHPTTEAHLAASRNPTLLVHLSARGSRDEVSGVRISARGLLRAVLQTVPTDGICTLLPVVRAGLVAGLSHVRGDVRTDTVKMIVMIGETLQVGWMMDAAQERSVKGVFAGLVQAVKTRPVAVHVMKAVIICVKKGKREKDIQGDEFYYQRKVMMGIQGVVIPEKELKELQKVLVEVMLECRGKGMVGCKAMEALVEVIEMSGVVEEEVKRVVGMEIGEGRVEVGRLMMKVGWVKEAGEVICKVLDEGGWGEGVEKVITEIMEVGEKELRRMVGKSWVKGWAMKGKKNDGKGVKIGMNLLKVILEKGEVVKECVETISRLVRIGLEEGILEDMIDLVRMMCEKEQDLEENVEKVLRSGCEIDVWDKLNEEISKKIIGLGYMCGKLFCDDIVLAIGWSRENGREETVKSFVDAIESGIRMRKRAWYEDAIALANTLHFDMTRSVKLIEKDVSHVHSMTPI